MVTGFKPKNKEIEKVFDSLIDRSTVVVKPRIAMDLSRYRGIRYYREKGNIVIAHDRNLHKSIIHLLNGKKLTKKKNKYFF